MTLSNIKINSIKATAQTVDEIEFFRIDNDVNGNPRYVFHYLDVNNDFDTAHDIVLKNGGRKYTANWFGGGFVIQSYNLLDTAKRLNATL
jgi:hypothetical protein